MDPSELWSALDGIKDICTITIKPQESPHFGRRIIVFVILRNQREGEGTAGDPRAARASQVKETGDDRLVTASSKRHALKDTRQDQVFHIINWTEDCLDI